MASLNMPSLSFWMAGVKNTTLARAAHRWFSLLGTSVLWVAEQMDARTCPEAMLDLLAWQRAVNRYPGEPDRLYRLRVHYAYHNGVDAGSINGWHRIFARLEMGRIALEERVTGQDWDIINLVVDDSSFPDQQNVLEIIVDEYGRTCRRYRFVSRIPQAVRVGLGLFDDDHTTVCAVQGVGICAACATGVTYFDHDHNTTEAHAWA